MNKTIVKIGLLTVLPAGLLIFALPAVQQERAVSPAAVIKTISVPASAFIPKVEHKAWTAEISTYIELTYCDNTHAAFQTPGFFAPVILPDGSEIVKIKLCCIDNGSYQINLKLLRFSSTGTTQSLFAVGSTGADSSYRTFSSAWSPVTLDNVNNSYMLKLKMPEDNSLDGKFNCAKIFYRNATW